MLKRLKLGHCYYIGHVASSLVNFILSPASLERKDAKLMEDTAT